MKRTTLLLLALLCATMTLAQSKVRHVCVDKNATPMERYAAAQLRDFLYKGQLNTDTIAAKEGTIYVGNTHYLRKHFNMGELHDGGYLICGDGCNLCLYGAGEKGTLYAVYAYLEKIGYRCYTPTALVIPDIFGIEVPKCNEVSNPAFVYREVSYYYPNHSQLYADWHHLHTVADRDSLFGMFVHTFKDLIPPARYYDSHPEWFSLNNGRRSRDGQLCLSNPAVLEELCRRLADTMATAPEKKMWSVSNNDNYNACQCPDCLHMDSLYGGPTGTLLHFVNQVARRFPNKTISTLAYQYTRCAPTNPEVKPEKNVNIMFCSIECGRELPIAGNPREASFRKDMEDWSRLTDNIFMWDYVVQFRNFWNPFPNLHVLQPNLQFFHKNGVRMMFEQATGADNITSWMDIRCYMIAKLLWDPYCNIDSIMDDFYRGYYGDAGRYVKEIIDTMTATLIASGQKLNIYGYPVDGDYFAPDNPNVGYLYPTKMVHYYDLMRKAEECTKDSAQSERLHYFRLALDFAHLEICYGDPSEAEIMGEIDRLEQGLRHFGVPQMMEMGCSPQEYAADMRHWAGKVFGDNLAYGWKETLRKKPTAPYNVGSLTDGDIGIMDYRHSWLGFWGDTLDAVVDLGEPQPFTYIGIDFYFYPLSWIFLPQWVQFAVSEDGERWEWRPKQKIDNPEVLATPDIYTYALETACTIGGEPNKYRYVRVMAVPLTEIPSWHRAAGQKPWIFIDEIIVK